MKDIKWEYEDVCFADGRIWKASPYNPDGVFWETNTGHSLKCRQESFEEVIKYEDFQLNDVIKGDCIVVDEFDTREDYENALDVFDLFGSPRYENASFEDTLLSKWLVVDKEGDLVGVDYSVSDCKRMINFQQLMAIGKLKQAMIERDHYLSKTKNLCGLENSAYYLSRVLESMSQPTASFIIPSDCGIDSESVDKDTKESKAYDLLKSMNISYDEEKEKWYKKEYL